MNAPQRELLIQELLDTPVFKASSKAQPVASPRFPVTRLSEPRQIQGVREPIVLIAPASPPIPTTDRWWFGAMTSAVLHGLAVLAVIFGGAFVATQPPPPLVVIAEISLGGLAGPGGSGGDGQASGGSPAALSEAAQGPSAPPEQGEKVSPPETVPEPQPAEPENAAVQPAPDPEPVLTSPLDQPEQKPAPKPKPKPKATPKPKAHPKAMRPAEPAQASANAASAGTGAGTAVATASPGAGTGQGLGGDGPGKGLGHGDGPPGVGGGPGGGGGGNATGQFGQGDGPRFRHRCLPRYPAEAKSANKEGNVCLRLTIDESGILRNVDVVEHSGLEFVEEALRAIRASSFYPAQHQGHPVASRALLTIRFKLS